MTSSRFRFTGKPSTDFSRELRASVEDYFRTSQLSPHANAPMIAKSFAMLAFIVIPYGFVLSGILPPLAALACCIVMGCGIAGAGFCIGHDALHGAYSASRRRNQWLGFVFEMVGANRSFWKLTHNAAHHTYTNVAGADLDLTVADPLVRLSPYSPRHAYHRLQHIYAWFLYSLTTLNWIFLKDYQYLLAARFRDALGSRLGRGEISALFAFKALHYGWTLVVPFCVLDLPFWQVLIGFGAMHLTAGLVLSVVFQLAHVIDRLPVIAAEKDGAIPAEWWAHQLRTTSNFATGNRWLSWFVGGLNYQIEHHLFPRICSIHYPALAPIVEDAARRHGYPYHHVPTLRGAIAAHYRRLRELGRPPRELALGAAQARLRFAVARKSGSSTGSFSGPSTR